MNALTHPQKLPCGKVIIKECDCPKHNRHSAVGSYTSPNALMSDYVVVSYWCTRCYRKGIIQAVRRW